MIPALIPVPLPPENPPIVSEPRRSGRTQRIEGRYRALDEHGKENAKIADTEISFEEIIENVLIANPADEPSFRDALEGDEKEKWIEAMGEELQQLVKVNTFTVVKAPRDANIIDGKWVLRRKRNGEGKVIRWKARYVVRGFKQQFGVDFTETFAPTIRPATLRTLFSLAASNNSVIVQADAKNAYLHGHNDTNEVFYMTIPDEFLRFHKLPIHLQNEPLETLCCRMWRPLYGSKQGAHHFHRFMVEVMTSLGFTVSNADEALYFKSNPDGSYLIVGSATDDFTIVADSDTTANSFLDDLGKRVELVRLGKITWLLGTTVTRDLSQKTISLGQTAYIEQLCVRFGLENARTVTTPLPAGIDLTPGTPHISSSLCSDREKKTYRELIGSLMYLSVMTRPDITYSVSVLSQHLEQPSITHLEFARRVLRYAKGTKTLQLVLGGEESLTAYSDADWASQLHRHSISGFSLIVGKGAISWSSKKQPIVTLSSTESEYVALTQASKDVIWMGKLLSEIGFISSIPFKFPINLACDNQGAITLSKDSTFHARTKHIDVHFHFIRQCIIQEHISLFYLPTSDMIADIFTKSLPYHTFIRFRSSLGLS
jgi:hypothetical protein